MNIYSHWSAFGCPCKSDHSKLLFEQSPLIKPSHTTPPPVVHFWAPSFKWGISLANLADYNRPAEFISVPQQCGASCVALHYMHHK